MKYLYIFLFLFLFGCEVHQTVRESKNETRVYFDYGWDVVIQDVTHNGCKYTIFKDGGSGIFVIKHENKVEQE